MAEQNDRENTGSPSWERMANRRSSSGQEGNGSARRQSSSNSTSRQSAGRSSGSSGNRGKRKKNNSDHLMNLFLILLLLTIIVLAILYFKKDKDEPADNVPTVPPDRVTQIPEGTLGADVTKTPSISVTPYQEGTFSTPEAGTTGAPQEPSGTSQAPEATPTPNPTSGAEMITPDPTNAPESTNPDSAEQTPAPNPGNTEIDAEEANDILAGIFWEAGYRFTLSDSGFSKGDTEYFRYDVSYGGRTQDYDVLVKKNDGDVYFYEDGIIREFDGLPEHTQQDGEKEDKEITADSAAELLKEIPYTLLGLPANLDECSLALDNWKTVVAGEESYCLNVFYQGTLAGNIYFTEDAEHVYYLDEFGEFVKVR